MRAVTASTVCLLAGAVLGYAVSHERGSDRPRSPRDVASAPSGTTLSVPSAAGPSELALVAPLASGSPFEGYVVERVDAVYDGTVGVVLVRENEGHSVRLDVALASPSAPQAAATAGAYAVYYSVRGAPSGDGERLALALARLLATGGDRPPPRGLGAFHDRPH
jgi:hypothetical protein